MLIGLFCMFMGHFCRNLRAAMLQRRLRHEGHSHPPCVLQGVAGYCREFQGVSVCFRVLQCVAVCVAVCCSVLQCVAESGWPTPTFLH